MRIYLDESFNDNKISDGNIRRLAARLKPATIQQLALYFEGTYLGDMSVPGPREKDAIPLPRYHNPAREWLLARAIALQCDNGPAPDCISGKDWLAHLNTRGSKELGELIRLANDLRDDRELTKDEILKLVPSASSPAETLGVLNTLLTAKE